MWTITECVNEILKNKKTMTVSYQKTDHNYNSLNELDWKLNYCILNIIKVCLIVFSEEKEEKGAFFFSEKNYNFFLGYFLRIKL